MQLLLPRLVQTRKKKAINYVQERMNILEKFRNGGPRYEHWGSQIVPHLTKWEKENLGKKKITDDFVAQVREVAESLLPPGTKHG